MGVKRVVLNIESITKITNVCFTSNFLSLSLSSLEGLVPSK